MSENVHRFRVLAEDLCELIEKEGLLIRPYRLATLPFFQALNLEEQGQVLQHLQNYYDICAAVVGQGDSLRDEHLLVEKALRHFKLQVSPQALFRSNDRIVYEFYSLNQTQYFRTMNFFEFNSYTVEDIYCRSWFNLYERDEGITTQIMKYANALVTEKTKDVVYPSIREHLLVERASLEKLKVPVKFLCMAPLLQDGHTVGVICVTQSSGGFY